MLLLVSSRYSPAHVFAVNTHGIISCRRECSVPQHWQPSPTRYLHLCPLVVQWAVQHCFWQALWAASSQRPGSAGYCTTAPPVSLLLSCCLYHKWRCSMCNFLSWCNADCAVNLQMGFPDRNAQQDQDRVDRSHGRCRISSSIWHKRKASAGSACGCILASSWSTHSSSEVMHCNLASDPAIFTKCHTCMTYPYWVQASGNLLADEHVVHFRHDCGCLHWCVVPNTPLLSHEKVKRIHTTFTLWMTFFYAVTQNTWACLTSLTKLEFAETIGRWCKSCLSCKPMINLEIDHYYDHAVDNWTFWWRN